MDNRANIIEQLAASMGVVGQTKYEESRYDAKTGTLYCQGMAISKITADKAVSYFETMANKCNSDDPQGREMKMIYICAIEAIKMMQAQKVKEMLKDDAEKL